MNISSQKLANLFSRILFGRTDGSSYRRFRFILFIGMIGISLIPVYVTTALHYNEYRALLHREERDQLRSSSLGGKSRVEAYVEQYMSVVRFITMQYSYEELLDQNTTSELLENIRKEYAGFVDLGVVNTDGTLQTYAGPYRLQGVDYSDQQWYHQVLVRTVYVSNVFMGFREVPHFVIAASTKLPGKQEYWVLRVSIDIKSLEQVISRVVAKEARDLFLVDANGLLQTPSRNFGGVLDRYEYFSQPLKNVIDVREKQFNDGQEILQAVVAIENSPWYLVITKVGYSQSDVWKSFSGRIRMIIITSSVLVIVVIFQVVKLLTDRLKDEEQKKRALLSEAEHTSKLASIGRLAAGVAHEINNPLAVISQNAGLMADLIEISKSFENREKFTTSINGIQNAVERCKKITHRLLGFARRMDINLENIDIKDLLHEVLGFLEREALYSQIGIELHIPDDLPMIVSDRGQLQQIFLNILNNGIDAIGKDGTLTITTRVLLSGMIQVAIKDTGPGMTPEIMKHIFDPFFTTKEANKGTGLGLSITYGLVKKLGGNIDVVSEVGKGSIFYVSLPVTNPSRRDENV
ncbi:MAG: ATP-binding protein [Desulfobulbaceae bacterium]|nr:ATP-binding protein [Desulfobulbaceae bacterium]